MKRPITSFIVLTNLIFFPLFLLTGATMMLGFPTWVFDLMLCIASWSSTFAFIILFKRLYPGQTITQYVKDQFKTKLNFKLIIGIITIQLLIMAIIIWIFSPQTSGAGPVFTITSGGMLSYFFIKNLFAGPLGEELGWRGFVQMELQKKYSPLVAALIVGFWWGIWHLPIWFTTGFMGLELVKYIIFFMISIVSISIILAACYHLNKNLLIPIIIHQLFNFFVGLINGNIIDIIGYTAVLYAIVALIFIVVNPKKVLYERK